MTPTVFERSDALTRVGGGIVVHSNGLRALEGLGLLESFKPFMRPCHKLTLQLGNRWKLVNEYSALPIPQNYFAIVLRQHLQKHFLEAARKVASIHFGHRCTAIEERPHTVQLRFDNGNTTGCDVLIAADGVHSQVRECLPIGVVRKSAGDAYLRGISELPSCDEPALEIWGR
jgi:salicylate hydroxylase